MFSFEGSDTFPVGDDDGNPFVKKFVADDLNGLFVVLLQGNKGAHVFFINTKTDANLVQTVLGV